MSEDPGVLAHRYRGKGVLVDTNLLLLWFVGRMDRQWVSQFKRTQKFLPADFDVLDRFLARFPTHVTIPNVLTEVSNLASQMGSRSEIFFEKVFSKAIQTLEEHYIPSKSNFAPGALQTFGITDCCIIALVKGNYLLLTDDFRLSQFFNSVGGDAINFNHIRLLNGNT
jgi:hypothetical protein